MLKSLWTPSSYQAESALKGMINGKHRQQMGGEEHPFPSYFGHHANEWICGQLMFLNGAAHAIYFIGKHKNVADIEWLFGRRNPVMKQGSLHFAPGPLW